MSKLKTKSKYEDCPPELVERRMDMVLDDIIAKRTEFINNYGVAPNTIFMSPRTIGVIRSLIYSTKLLGDSNYMGCIYGMNIYTMDCIRGSEIIVGLTDLKVFFNTIDNIC